MKYVKLSFEYLKLKKLYIYFLFALIPSVLFVIISPELTISRLLIELNKNITLTTPQIFNLIFGNVKFLIGIFGIIIATVMVAFMMGIIDRDMKIGDFRIQNFAKRVNYNFVIAFLCMLFVIVVVAIYKSLCSLIVLLWIRTITNIVLMNILIVLSFCLLYFFIMLFIATFALVPPTIVISGQRWSFAVSQSVRSMKGKVFKLLIALLIPVILKSLLLQLFALMGPVGVIVGRIILNAFLLIYFITIIFVAYYDIMDIDRADQKNKIKW